jgi:hypothetical protein
VPTRTLRFPAAASCVTALNLLRHAFIRLLKTSPTTHTVTKVRNAADSALIIAVLANNALGSEATRSKLKYVDTKAVTLKKPASVTANKASFTPRIFDPSFPTIEELPVPAGTALLRSLLESMTLLFFI